MQSYGICSKRPIVGDPDYVSFATCKRMFPGFLMQDGQWKFLDYLPVFDEHGFCYEEAWQGEYIN
jgi:hypothetical protein